MMSACLPKIIFSTEVNKFNFVKTAQSGFSFLGEFHNQLTSPKEVLLIF